MQNDTRVGFVGEEIRWGRYLLAPYVGDQAVSTADRSAFEPRRRLVFADGPLAAPVANR